MEILFELLFNFIFEVVLQLVGELGFRLVGKLLTNRVTRLVLGVAGGGSLAYYGGQWRGDRLADGGQIDTPTSFWVSIALAVMFGTLALVRTLRGRRYLPPFEPDSMFDVPTEALPYLSPLRWPPLRLLSFAAVNVALAVGIHSGFTAARALR